MHVISFLGFEQFGKIPRSNDRKTTEISLASGQTKLVFISHRWLRTTRKECEGRGHKWAGMPHPDDDVGSKHRLVCAGIHKLAKEKGWDVNNVSLWLDFCGIEQDDEQLLQAGVASLRGYVSLCDAMLIPSPEVPPEDAWTVDKIPGEYGARAWTRLESLSFYSVSYVILSVCRYTYWCIYLNQNLE